MNKKTIYCAHDMFITRAFPFLRDAISIHSAVAFKKPGFQFDFFFFIFIIKIPTVSILMRISRKCLNSSLCVRFGKLNIRKENVPSAVLQ